jgi:hypothetical protein
MKRRLLLAAVATLAVAAPAFADQLLLGFVGFDYHAAVPASTHYLDVGDSYSSIGFVTSFDPGLLGGHFDTSVNEYTYFMFNMNVLTTFYNGSFLESDFDNATGARARFYEDAIVTGTHAQYGTAPPNPSSPSSFTDGAIALGGRISNLVLTYDFTQGLGSFSGSIDLDEGTDLIYIPPSERTGWVLGGIAGTQIIPAGYDHQVSGQCQVPSQTATRHVTWGAMKKLYR